MNCPATCDVIFLCSSAKKGPPPPALGPSPLSPLPPQLLECWGVAGRDALPYQREGVWCTDPPRGQRNRHHEAPGRYIVWCLCLAAHSSPNIYSLAGPGQCTDPTRRLTVPVPLPSRRVGTSNALWWYGKASRPNTPQPSKSWGRGGKGLAYKYNAVRGCRRQGEGGGGREEGGWGVEE